MFDCQVHFTFIINHAIMRFTTLSSLLLIGLIVTGFAGLEFVRSASEEPILPATPYNYADIDLPPSVLNNLAQIETMPADNQLTDAGATLGRVLFYDKALSQNQTISCASCHQQASGFSDPAQFSTGFEGGLTGRNSMGLAHVRFMGNSQFFWDGRANSLEEQALGPIQNELEMGLTLSELELRISNTPYYQPLFTAAFGDATVTSDRVAKALAQFMYSMTTYDSKFAQGLELANNQNNNFPNFTEQENLGKALFRDAERGNCQSCHTRSIFIPAAMRNIGLDLVYADQGRGEVTGNPNHFGQFKVPSLINIEMTAPHMHDGRFQTLDQVIDFYSDSIQAHPNLDQRLRNPDGTPKRLNYTPEEKAALKAFLLTLTDHTLLTNLKWSDPFIPADCGGGATIGNACDDGDPCTINDVFDNHCNCAGTFADADNDGVCDANDQCSDVDDALIGTACNDGDTCTVNDVYGTNCNCLGTFADADNDGVCDANDQCPNGDDHMDLDANGIPDACEGCDYISFDAQDFEAGLGIWNRGMGARRSDRDAAFANSGNLCVRLRDNSANAFTDALDFSSFDEITLDFSFITDGMSGNSDAFGLQVSTDNGVTYNTVRTWTFGTDFLDNERHNETVVISGPFTATTTLRFINFVTSRQDRLHLDDVVITGCESNDPARSFETASSEKMPESVETAQDFLNVYPNPAQDRITVHTSAQTKTVRILSLSGRFVAEKTLTGSETTLNIEDLETGVYLVSLHGAQGVITVRFVKY